MKKSFLTIALIWGISHIAFAKNTTTQVEQVTSAITLSEDVDYVITGTDPFTTTGSINITNKDHAVVILKKIRPSKALSYLGYITIDGQPAVNDENCQVKMYSQGAIILPYDKDIKPLTVYSEQNFEGESVNDFGLENSGGYMNTLTTAKLNNRIRSFKLKRGYMVTFSNNPGGRGYSRCFIADNEDLEVATLPVVLDQHISSYRIFKWNDAEKKGLANDTRTESTQALNVSWCYSFSAGEDKGMDCECVPHHIYEGWPGIADLGSRTYSPHMKTNNEPGNSADDHPQSVEEVLANWQDLMATGMRLCSPSSHDGSLNWLYTFMDEIDKRGWRCDILDLHCYWPTNSFNGLSSWYDRYKRPIWISEFVWGASWNNNGIFGAVSDRNSFSIENQQKNYDGMKPILDNLNKWPYIERYAYWNSEANCSKIYLDGQLSLLGDYYAEMESGIGYNKAYEYVPKVVYFDPSDFTVTYNELTRKLNIEWTNENMELTDSTYLELQIDQEGWKTVQIYPASEKTAFTYTETFPADFKKGTYTYRIHNFDCDGEQRYSEEISISLSGAQGSQELQYGHMEISSTDENTSYFTALEEGEPAVFVGLISRNNINAALVNNVVSVTNDRFTFKYSPWTYGGYNNTMTKSETTDYMVMPIGHYQYGDITMEVGETPTRIGRDTTWISFTQPFPEDITPVVIASLTNRTNSNYSIKIWGITNEGFYAKMLRQAEIENSSASSTGQYFFYVAATPGQAKIDNNKLLTVGTSSQLIDGKVARTAKFLNANEEQYEIVNPYILCGPQTNNFDCATIFRIGGYTTSSIVGDDETYTITTGMKIIRQKDETAEGLPNDLTTVSGDTMGWLVVSDDLNPTGINETATDQSINVYVENKHIVVEGTQSYEIFNVNGQSMNKNTSLSNGLYIVKTPKKVVKVLVQ